MARREYQNPSILTRQGKFGPEYYIRYRVKVVRMVGGKAKQTKREKWHALGLCSETTLRKAERKKADIMREVNGQAYSVQSQIPFTDFVTLYKERYLPTLKVTTQRNYKAQLTRFIEPYFAGKKLCDIKPEHVHQFITGLELAPLTRKSIKGLLSGIYTLAIHWGYWKEQNPVKMAFLARDLPDTRVREKKLWTPGEVQAIMMAVRPDVALLIETLMWTGLRISEALGMRWKSVNLNTGFILVQERQSRGDFDTPKSKKSRRFLPMGILTAKYKELRGDRGDNDLVFHDEDKPYSDCSLLANYLTPILVGLGLKFEGAGWHQFRRSFLTWFSESGATAFEVQEQAGHGSMETTMLYIQPDLARRKSVVESMQANYAELCGKREGSDVVH